MGDKKQQQNWTSTPHSCITRAPDMALKQPQAPIRRKQSKATQCKAKQVTWRRAKQRSSDETSQGFRCYAINTRSRLPNQSHKAKNSLILMLEQAWLLKLGHRLLYNVSNEVSEMRQIFQRLSRHERIAPQKNEKGKKFKSLYTTNSGVLLNWSQLLFPWILADTRHLQPITVDYN